MKINPKTQFIILAVLLVASFILIYPSFANPPSWWKGILPSQKINLGLDLKGGMYLVLEVEADKAVETTLENRAQRIKKDIKDLETRILPGLKIALSVPIDEEGLLKSKIEDVRLKVVDSKIENGKFTLIATLSPREIKEIEDMAVNQSLDTIRNRIDQFGVAEPSIQRQGTDRIVVQLPGIKNPQQAINLIGKTARLEFKLVDDENMKKIDLRKLVDEAIKENPKAKDDPKILNELLKGKIPDDDEVLFERRVDKDTGYVTRIPLLVKKTPLLTGDMVTDARVRQDYQFNEPYVAIEFNSDGADIFAQVTGENVGKRLAIVLDNTIYSAPVIRERIPGGRAQITGNFSWDEARELAIVLRAGALPAPVKILQKWTVGPSLGEDSIKRGIIATIVGGILVVFFMWIYYGISGLIADVALILNLVFMLAILAAFQATLTLPGIAGIVLTIGMAVDANIIIFERIREELLNGKTPRAAIEAGYSRAVITILDANVTTLIAAIVLFQFGSGPVKGFAVTLSIGIITSMYTAIFVTRAIQEALLDRKAKAGAPQAISI